jgi:hypothetical protein
MVPDCDLNNPAANGECAALDNQNLGRPVFTRNFDPNFVSGWGTRPYNWSMGFVVQHELLPRVSATLTFNRNWWGNWYVVDNRSTVAADYTPYAINAPRDPRLPGGGGNRIDGLYNLVPTKVGQVDELAQSYKNFGDQIENWQGIDVSIAARLQNGHGAGRHEHGTQALRRLRCAGATARARFRPDRVDEQLRDGKRQRTRRWPVRPFSEQPLLPNRGTLQDGLRGLASYIVPKVDIQLAATWASIPGDSLRADYTLTAADQATIAAEIGRSLTGAFNTVNLIAPATLWGARQNNVDLRIAKLLRFGTTRTLVGVDIFNLLNADTVTLYNLGFVAAARG